MAIHEFICKGCNIVKCTSDTSGHRCPTCGKAMSWNLKRANTASGDYSHISDSLAVNPNQIAEHRQIFPDVNIHPDGRPEFTSVKQHDDYLKKAGFVKMPQKLKKKTVKL